MECGEIDFAHILAKHQGVPLGLNFIRVYWEQMLQAVQAIHEEKIVHSDLKPANFLLVAGQLKLIDFGIAKRMGDDTTNIHRDQQVYPLRNPFPPSPLPLFAQQTSISC
jgi:serine/threonine-protein kinase TTK/MPS1